MAISMLKIRRPLGRLIFNMGIAIPGKTVFLIETAPRMHLFHIPQCSIQNRNVHISVLDGALWDIEQVYSGICEIGLLLYGMYCEFKKKKKKKKKPGGTLP